MKSGGVDSCQGVFTPPLIRSVFTSVRVYSGPNAAEHRVIASSIANVYIFIWLFYLFHSSNCNIKATVVGAITEDIVKCCCY